MERPLARPSSSFKRSRRSPRPSSKFTSRLNSSSGTKQSKKVKFADFGDALDTPAHAKRTTLKHRTGGAKTSEFLYFKKICGAAGQKEIFKPQNEQAQESNEIRTALSDKVEKETHFGSIHSVSPREEQLNEEPNCSGLSSYGLDDTPIYKLHRESLVPAFKVTPLAQEPLLLSPEASRNSHTKCENGGVFSEKRRNLIKLAAKTLSVGVDDFSVRRSDLIAELTQRLGLKQQPGTQKSISSSHLEIRSKRYNHFEHGFKLENSGHYASNLATVPPIEAGPEPNVGSRWSIRELESSELYPDFDMGFKYAHDNLLPPSPSHDLVPYSYSFGTQVQDQSLVPYDCSPSPVEKFNSELTGWVVREREERESHLPLALCNPFPFCDEAEEFGGNVLFGSPQRKKGSALEWNSSPLCGRENYSQISDADFSFANERSLVLVKENSVNPVLGFGFDLPILGPRHSLDGSNWCAYQRDTSDLFLIDN